MPDLFSNQPTTRGAGPAPAETSARAPARESKSAPADSSASGGARGVPSPPSRAAIPSPKPAAPPRRAPSPEEQAESARTFGRAILFAAKRMTREPATGHWLSPPHPPHGSRFGFCAACGDQLVKDGVAIINDAGELLPKLHHQQEAA